MKNIMAYISPTKSFDNPRKDLASNDAGQCAKVQIENSRALGWKKHDIMIATNFPFKYGDFSTTVLKNVEFFERKPQVSKINAIVKLFENKMIQKNELYWFHDLDAFQLEPIRESDIDIAENQIALTEYGGLYFRGKPRWSTGTIFFKSGSKDIFEKIKDIAYKKRVDEEEALTLLTESDKTIKQRVKKIDYTYNFIGYNLQTYYYKAIRPLKVAHFHPMVGKSKLFGVGKQNALRFFQGENPLSTPLITERVAKLLKYHRMG